MTALCDIIPYRRFDVDGDNQMCSTSVKMSFYSGAPRRLILRLVSLTRDRPHHSHANHDTSTGIFCSSRFSSRSIDSRQCQRNVGRFEIGPIHLISISHYSFIDVVCAFHSCRLRTPLLRQCYEADYNSILSLRTQCVYVPSSCPRS